MIAAEFKNARSTIRIHDEYCATPPAYCMPRLSRIVSDSYKRRQLSDRKPVMNSTAADSTGNTAGMGYPN